MDYLNKSTISFIIINLINIVVSILISIILLKIIKSKKLIRSTQSENHLINNMDKGFLIDFYLSTNSCSEDYSQIDLYESIQTNINCKCKIENYNSIIDLYYKDNNCDLLKKRINKIIISFNENIRKNKENYNVECNNDNQIMINACMKYSEYKYIDLYNHFINKMTMTNRNYSYYIHEILMNKNTEDVVKNAILDVTIEKDKVNIKRIKDLIIENNISINLNNTKHFSEIIKKSIGSLISDVFIYKYPVFKVMNNELYIKNKNLYKFSENLNIKNAQDTYKISDFLYNLYEDQNFELKSSRKLVLKTFPFCEFLDFNNIYSSDYCKRIEIVYIIWILSLLYLLLITYINIFLKNKLSKYIIFKIFILIFFTFSCALVIFFIYFTYYNLELIYKKYKINVKICEGVSNVLFEFYNNVLFEYSIFIRILTLLVGLLILIHMLLESNLFKCNNKKKVNEIINF